MEESRTTLSSFLKVGTVNSQDALVDSLLPL